LVLAVVLAAAGAFALGKQQAEGPNDQVAPPARGLPPTPDYHALYVDPANSRRLLLGTHVGMYESRDGGATWTTGPLGGQDVMNIVETPDGALWVAGHNVLARSEDDGITWSDVRPDGLPHLDLHGFTADARGRLFAAAAGDGLYTSTDGGATFTKVSDEVGAGVWGMVAFPDGTLLAAEPARGIQQSEDGGRTWQRALAAPILRLAWSPAGGDTVVATGESVWRSEDRGATWKEGFAPGASLEPVAAAVDEPGVFYAIAPQTRTLYRSDDGGENWAPVN
jgi:photosystem II stability/assembly factor-like uncharacterized protein